VLAVVWDKFSSTINFVQSQSYVDFLGQLEPLAVEPPSTTHCVVADPKRDLETLFGASALELAQIRLKADKIHRHYVTFQTEAGSMIAAAKGYVGLFQSPQVEDR